MAKTIDRYDFETYQRYAERSEQARADKDYFQGARGIPLQTRVEVTEIAFPSEFDTLFEIGKQRAPWASIEPPADYSSRRRRLFAELIMPNLGSPEKQELLTERLSEIPSGLENIKKEKEILLKLMGTIHTFDQQIIDINGYRGQYKKG